MPSSEPTPSDRSGPARRRRVLIGLNLALLAGLTLVWASATPSAAQPAGAASRLRGEYTILSGRIQGSTSRAVFIFDAANQELVALKWERSTNRFEGIGWRSVASDARLQREGR